MPELPSTVPPPPRISRATVIATVIAVLLAAAVPTAAAFNFDLCAFTHAAGINLDACEQAPALSPEVAP